nr:insecticidal protein IPD093Aa [Pseudomonas chlororaphis]
MKPSKFYQTAAIYPSEEFKGKLSEVARVVAREQSKAVTVKTGAQDIQPKSTSAINENLISLPEVTEEEKKMVEYTLLWIQMVTLGIAKSHGWTEEDWSDITKRNSPEYWGFVTSAIVDHTKWALISYNNQQVVKEDNNSGQIELYKIVQAAVGLILGTSASDAMALFAEKMAIDTSVPVDNVGTFFWNSKYNERKSSQWAIGPVIREDNGYLSTAYAYTYMTYTQSSWRALFVQSDYESFELLVKGLAIRFFESGWGLVSDAVYERLKDFLEESIEDAPFP